MGRKPALLRGASLRPERDALEERRTTRTSATSPRRTGEADETVSSTSTALGREAERQELPQEQELPSRSEMRRQEQELPRERDEIATIIPQGRAEAHSTEMIPPGKRGKKES